MKLLAYFRSMGEKFFRPSQLAQEMDEELRSHIALRAEDLERGGLDRKEAERRARIEFGGEEKVKHECHQALGGNLIETAIQDVRLTLRMLRKSPGFALAAILTLALAIGANTVVFSIMNAFIIRPLNVPHAESLYGLWRLDDDMSESYPDYVDLRDRNHSFDALIAYNVNEVALDTGNNPSRSWIEEASGNFFDGLNVQPYLGRFFHASDEHGPNSAPYIVLTYKYWHTHFHDDRGVIGQNVAVNKHPYTVIGVAPPEFHGTLLFFHPDFFVPIVNHDIDGGTQLNDRRSHWVFMTMGHLKSGVTPGQAVADLNSIGQDLLRKYRPVGPPADLRSRILVPERAAWPWAVAAAVLMAVTLGFHAATGALNAPNGTAYEDPPGVDQRIAYGTTALGGGDEARRVATLIVMEEEVRRALPAVATASSSQDAR